MQIAQLYNDHWIQTAVDILNSGGIVLHPTDTSYGLAIDATNVEAIQKVFDLKKRHDKPLPIVVRDKEQAQEYTEINEVAERLIEAFWPGALTIVLPKKDSLPDALTCGSHKVGIRIPNHSVTHQLSEAATLPYTSTSANLSGQPDTYTINDVTAQLDETKINFAIDVGELPWTPPSTVVDTTQTLPKILREGNISQDQILGVL